MNNKIFESCFISASRYHTNCLMLKYFSNQFTSLKTQKLESLVQKDYSDYSDQWNKTRDEKKYCKKHKNA